MTDAQKPLPADTYHLPLTLERDSTVIRFRKEPLLATAVAQDPVSLNVVPSGSDDPYQQLLDTICDVVLVSTVAGDITDANRKAVDFLLYDMEELRRMSVTTIIAGADTNFLPAILTSLDMEEHAHLEAKCIRKDGSLFSVEIAVSRIHGGDQTRLFLLIRDMTVRKQAEKALRETLSRLEKQDRARALLVSNVTHELRTPLTSIMYGLSNLLTGVVGPVTPPVRQYLERFNRECQRLLSTVEDILYLERIETKTLRLSRISASASKLVAKAITALELNARHKNIILNRHFAAASMFTYCDPAKMDRVLMNIIGNAIKYTPNGGSVAVSIDKHQSKYQTLVIRIEDTGVGIPAHAINSVMDRYYRVGEQADGAGLGLAIAKEIIEIHGGSIQIASPPPGKNLGTLVSINIPLADPPDLLVLSNEESMGRTIMEELISTGYRVSVATGSKEAMAWIRDKHVDLLIVDFPLKDSDGTETIIAVRGNERKRRIPIVVIAAGDLNVVQREIFSGLSIPMLMRPWTQDELSDGIERALLVPSGMVGELDH